jgi:hypothetical protein
MSKSTLSLPSSVKNQQTGGATVSVASKLPMQYILRLNKKIERTIQAHGGTHREVISLPSPEEGEYVIDGNSFPQNSGPYQQLAGGFAITHGIPKDFWEKWLSQYSHMDVVKKGFIFAHTEASSTIAHAKEMANEPSGFERLDPKKKYDVGQSISVNGNRKSMSVEAQGE